MVPPLRCVGRKSEGACTGGGAGVHTPICVLITIHLFDSAVKLLSGDGGVELNMFVN